MVISKSLQMSHELGIYKNHGNTKPFKSVMGQGKLPLLRVKFSSHAPDSLNIHLSDTVYRRKYHVPCRRNAFQCNAFLAPGQSFVLPNLKTVSLALTRSYDTLHGSPVVLKLLPAIGIISFALWGLGPLIRQGRNLILKKNDNNWKKSSTYFIISSYLQPLLLWTGATLICRALDPIILPSESSQVVKQRLLSFIRSLSTVVAFAYCLSSGILQAQKYFMETSDPSDTKNMGFQFAGKAVYSAVWVAAVSLFMELLGFSTQKWLTAGGLGTVLLTLAGREIFTNFLSSAMIHATRPFVVNQWIQTKIEGYEVSGTVEHVGWWSPTIVRGEDREAVHIPNHKFTVNVVRNLSQKTHWRIKTHLAISHLDASKINNIVADMRKVLAKNPQVEQQRLHRRVFLDNINPENQALLILVSCFVKTSHHEEYLCVKEAIFLDLLKIISHHRARLATPIRTIQKVYSEGNLENIAEAVFTGGGVPANRSLLLIEPPYKVNGEDKSKPQNRGNRTNAEQDNKSTAKSNADIKTKDVAVSSDTKEEMEAASTTSGVKSVLSDNKQAKKTMTTGLVNNSKTENPETSGGKAASRVNTSKPVLEDNIVLGVALDGSKRTLLIEEKELATLPNGNGSSVAAPSSPSGEV